MCKPYHPINKISIGTIKGGFLCARQTGIGWEKIGGWGVNDLVLLWGVFWYRSF